MFNVRPEFGFNISPQTDVPGFRVGLLDEDPPGFRIGQDGSSVRRNYPGTPAPNYDRYGNARQPSELLAALISSNPYISQSFRGSAAWGDLDQRSTRPAERGDVSDESISEIVSNPQQFRNAQLPDSLKQRCIDRCSGLILEAPFSKRPGTFDQCMAHCEGRAYFPQIQPFITYPTRPK